MEKIMHNKLAVKIICVALSLILWIYVSYTENPSMTKTIRNVPIVITGEQALKESGLAVYSISDSTADVKVTANRLTLARLNKKTVTAVINVSSVKEEGIHTLPVTATSSLTSNVSYYVKGADIKIVVEPISEKAFPIETVVEDLSDASIHLDSIKLSTEKVTVTAPDSIIKDIAFVKTTPILPEKDTTNQQVGLVVYAKSGKALEGTECSPSTVTASYTLLDVKTVPVVFKTENGKSHTLPSDYNIRICGSGDSFEAVKQISTEIVDVSHFTKGSTVRVKLDVPDGVKVIGGTKEIEVVLEDKYKN